MTAAEEQIVSPALPPFKDSYTRRLVQEKAAHYIGTWKALNDGIMKYAFHWPALFVPGLWLLYRKMYLYFGIYLVLDFVFLVVLGLIGQINTMLALVIFLASFVVPPFFAHRIYGHFVKTKIQKIMDETQDETERLNQMMDRGGTSLLSVVLGLIFVPITLEFTSSILGVE